MLVTHDPVPDMRRLELLQRKLLPEPHFGQGDFLI